MSDNNNGNNGKNGSNVLARKAMISTLETSSWSGRKVDKEATDELLRSKRADEGSGNFSKQLIDKEALSNIKSIISEARRYHKEITMAWDEKGGRLLPSTKYSSHTAKMRECQDKLKEEVDKFIENYDNLVNDSSYRLGDLFNNQEYPDKEELRNKFAINIDYDKVPEGNDFRLDIPEEEQEQIRKDIEKKVQDQHAEAMKRVWKRIYSAVENMHEKLKDEDKIFRNSMVRKIEDLVKILPELNVTDNKELATMTEELRNELCGIDPDDLRKDKEARKEAADKSGAVLERINELSHLYETA